MTHKILLPLILTALLLPVATSAQKSDIKHKINTTKPYKPRTANKGWKLVWADEFNGNKVDTSSWERCPRINAPWGRHMSNLDSLCQVKDGVLELHGICTPQGIDEKIPYLTGGLQSRSRHSIRNGRVDVRARFECGKGFWPAIWLMPDINIPWPQGGEIDIMEHLNYDDIIYQTVHSTHTRQQREPISKTSQTTPINRDDFNIYSVEVNENEIVFYVNNEKQFSYPKMNPTPEGQYPFSDHPFYVILSAQLGGDWVGEIDPADLPVKMEIDYVRFYKKR